MNSTFRSRALATTLLAVGAGLGIEVAFGANVFEALLYLGYQAGYVVLPGYALYMALSSRPGGMLRRLAFGWALGYVLEILAFMGTAATGTRPLFAAYPLIVGIPAAWLARRRRSARGPSDEPGLPRGFLLGLGGLLIVAMAYVALSYFSVSPLPGSRSVAYFQDYPWTLSIAAEAKNHWPILDPNVAGEAFPYHFFLHIDLAASSQVTGIGLPLIFLRLFILPVTVAMTLQLVVAGRSLSRNWWVGIVAACLVLLVGELQLDTTQALTSRLPFLGLFFTFLIISPTFLFGMVFFVPLVTALGELVSERDGPGRLGDWVIVALLAVGASDAKVSILPIVVVAIGLFAGWKLLMTRRLHLPTIAGGAITSLVLVGVYLLQYRGHDSGTSVDVLAGVDYLKSMPTVGFVREFISGGLPGFPAKNLLLSGFSVVFGLFGLLAAQFIGLRWLARRGWPDIGDIQIWYVAVLTSGLIELFFLDGGSNGTQQYAVQYGLVAGSILAAQGLQIGWESRPEMTGQGKRIAALVALAAMLLLAVIAVPRIALPGDSISDLRLRAFCWYGGLLVALLLIYGAARRATPRSRWLAGALVAGSLIFVGALDTPVESVEPGLADPSPAEPTAGQRMTPGIYDALAWVRDETPKDSVLAVNSHYNGLGPFQFIYAAFAERPVYLGGWGYSIRTRDAGYDRVVAGEVNPFSGRVRVNDAAFKGASVPALRRLERAGVDYLIVDSVNGYPVDLKALGHYTDPVYSGPGIVVLKLKPLSLFDPEVRFRTRTAPSFSG